ncbi:MAG: lasso peptide biosynthesis B2 protein [Pyrinomonadaceae bacterium]|nr:lasso peptide biosynthesis B2 protein [Pyrinomonadaceae bacterium]
MTPMLATSTPTPALDYTAIAKRHKDGSVLLSIADDRICKLNGVGALTWMVLEQAPHGLSLDAVVDELTAQFDAINAEGELLYEVSPEQLREDTARFLKNLTGMNLLEVIRDSRGREVYCIKQGVSGTTSSSVAAGNSTATPAEAKLSPSSTLESVTSTSAQDETTQPNGTDASVSAHEDIKLLKRETLTAFIGLAAFDLLLKFAGFQSLIRRVEHWPTSEPRTTDREICKRIRAMVDRAQMYYPKKAMCLQHSAVVTCLLRRRGVPAEMVLAAQEFPPKGHAWSEVVGEVVNDNPRVKAKYLELRRV